MTTDLLAVYDEHLRGDNEVLYATSVERLGPLWLAKGVVEGWLASGMAVWFRSVRSRIERHLF